MFIEVNGIKINLDNIVSICVPDPPSDTHGYVIYELSTTSGKVINIKLSLEHVRTFEDLIEKNYKVISFKDARQIRNI